MAKRVLDNIERDVIAAMRLGYGVHYGHYKADHPHTRENPQLPVPKPEPEKPVEAEQDAVCVFCGKMYIRNHGCRKYCSDECLKKAARARERNYYIKKHGEIKEVPCDECGKLFLPVNRRQIYCCQRCASRAGWKKQYRKRKEKTCEEQALAE